MVEGGLDEPDELEPVQGSLDLASPDDTATVADWEAAAAAVLRKAKRLGGDDADAVLEALSRGLTAKFLHGPQQALHHAQGDERARLASLLPQLFRGRR